VTTQDPLGYRANHFFMPKPKGTLRVFIIGDSVAFGQIHDFADSEPFSPGVVLQRLLTQRLARTVEVINLGFPGATSDFARVRAQEALAFSPDAVVVHVGVNDFNPTLTSATLDPGHCRKSWLRRTSTALDFAAFLLTRPRTDTKTELQLIPLVKTKLVSLLRRVRSRGVLVLYCIHTGRNPRELVSIRRMMLDATREAKVIAVDLQPPMLEAAARRSGGLASLFSDEIHPTREGYGIYSEAIIDGLVRSGFGSGR
jgi:lysophospholipase L1-like esterase